MILTVTLNPSIDIAYQLPTFQLDTVNRVPEVHKTPGGKGLNVTRVLAQLGDEVRASGLLGGKTGEFLAEGLDQAGIAHDFYTIAGDTRNCIAVLHDGNQTEILEQGPTISEKESQAFLNHFEELVTQADVVAISGSLPKGMPVDTYAQMVVICQIHQVPVVLDCSGEALYNSLVSPVKPTVIKPNVEELAQLLKKDVTDDVAVLKDTLSQDLFKGVEWVIVSLGANGTFAKHGDVFYKVTIPKITVVNPVGSGDSTVAGIASGLLHGENDADLLKKANTLGMLNAQEVLTGHVNMENYSRLWNQIKVEEV